MEPPAFEPRLERGRHPGHADRVHVRVQHERAPPAASPRDGDDVGASGRRLRERRLEPGSLAPAGDEACDLPLAGPSGDDIRVDRLDRDEARREVGDLAHVR